jgi:putative hydrolase of the HAD superfamily
MGMKIKAIAFDLDGTLYPDIYVYIRSVPLFALHPRFIYFFNKMRKEIRTLDKIDDFESMQAEIMSRKMGISSERAAALIKEIIYIKWEKYFKGAKLFPHVIETLTKLKSDGFKLALLSDYPLQSKLAVLGIDKIWDYSVSSDVVNYLKPRPEPFIHIREKLGFRFDEILYVGDRYKYDVIGAKGVGMMAAHFTKKKIPGSIADITFSDYGEFYDIVSRTTTLP